MRILWGLFFTALIIVSCINDDEAIASGKLNIRLANRSGYNFTNIVVDTSTGENSFDNLLPGQKSKYKTFERAYRYAFIEVDIAGKTYTIQPIDYVGESPLENGNYTYEISANNSQNRYGKLSMTLVQD